MKSIKKKKEKEKFKTEQYRRDAIFAPLKQFDHMADDDSEYVEITEWHNGEGIDVEIYCNKMSTRFILTYGQYDAIKYLLKQLNKKFDQIG